MPSKSHLRLFASPLLLVSFWTDLEAAPWIVFTEIHYRPTDDRLEFVELYNTSAPHADLGGWRIEGQIEFSLSRTNKARAR